MFDILDYLLDNAPGLTFGLLCLLLLGLPAVFTIQLARVERHCLNRGWREASVAWDLSGYCVARTDQSDIIVPWQEAKRR